MEPSATRPEWLPIVEQCARQLGNVQRLQDLADELGRGHFHTAADRPRLDGSRRCILYWVTPCPGMRGGRKSIRIGAFDLYGDKVRTPPSTRPRKVPPKPRISEHRMVKLTDGSVVAVFWELVRGEPVPRPVPVEQLEVMRQS